jgi:hypothetical protein
MRATVSFIVMTAATITACQPIGENELILLEGRAVAPAGDSILAITGSNIPGVLLFDRRTRTVDTLGAAGLESPAHIQWHENRWYVSDARDGLAWITVFGADGRVERDMNVDSITAVLHQFAVLPSGEIVLETRDDKLVALGENGIRTLALMEPSPRTGLLAAAQGGVLHLVPHKTITLYNELGKIRWRVDWEWDDTVFIIDISVDSQGRPNVLAGREGYDEFMVFGFSPFTGEVVRWQEGPSSTFSVNRFGNIEPDQPTRWTGSGEGT